MRFLAAICSEHFEEKYQRRSLANQLLHLTPRTERNLTEDAVPTLKVPNPPNPPNPPSESDKEVEIAERRKIVAQCIEEYQL